MSAALRYRLFGLLVESSILLPELELSCASGHPDVVITEEDLPRDWPSAGGRYAVPGGTLLCIAEAGRYACVGGERIVVEAKDGASDANVRLFLLGSALGLLLHQRGMLPLHANAIEFEEGALAFMGRSGAGKSTLAAWFADQGRRMLSDDVCAICFGESGQPIVFPGIPRLRLWRETLEAFRLDTANYRLSFEGDETYEKFDVPAPLDRGHDGASLRAVCLLEAGEQVGASRLSGVAAVEVVYANTYRGMFLDGVEARRVHWESCIRLVRTTPIVRVIRPWGLDRLGSSAHAMLAAVRQLLL